MNAKDWIEIGLSSAIATFAFLQWFTSKKKQKDDLFKIRWECYQEIVKYIKNTYEEKYEHYFLQCIDLDKEEQQIRDDFIKSKNLGLDLDQEPDIEQHFLISKAKLLFDDEVANLIKEFMYNHWTQLISKSVYQITIDKTIEPHPERLTRQLNEKYWTLSWLPSQEFEQKFDQYLKLK